MSGEVDVAWDLIAVDEGLFPRGEEEWVWGLRVLEEGVEGGGGGELREFVDSAAVGEGGDIEFKSGDGEGGVDAEEAGGI